jgi:hypothetical protein
VGAAPKESSLDITQHSKELVSLFFENTEEARRAKAKAKVGAGIEFFF